METAEQDSLTTARKAAHQAASAFFFDPVLRDWRRFLGRPAWVRRHQNRLLRAMTATAIAYHAALAKARRAP